MSLGAAVTGSSSSDHIPAKHEAGEGLSEQDMKEEGLTI